MYTLTRLLGNFLEGHPFHYCSKSSMLNCESSYGMSYRKRKMHFVDIGSTKQFLYVFLEPYSLILTQSQDLSHSDVIQVRIEGIGSRPLSCLVYQRPLSALVSLECYNNFQEQENYHNFIDHEIYDSLIINIL